MSQVNCLLTKTSFLQRNKIESRISTMRNSHCPGYNLKLLDIQRKKKERVIYNQKRNGNLLEDDVHVGISREEF